MIPIIEYKLKWQNRQNNERDVQEENYRDVKSNAMDKGIDDIESTGVLEIEIISGKKE
ncbi:MAG TPA: hypothetical protein VF691_05335 [Cytophagaceae bacterium]